MAEPTDDEELNEDEAPDKNPNSEAAKYRTKLREAEAKVTDLTAQVGELQSEALRLMLGDKLANPDDFDTFIGLEKVRAEDGRIDREKFDTEVAALLEDRPYLGAKKSAPPQLRNKAAEGTPAAGPAPADTRTALERAFPDNPDATWNKALDKFADTGPSSRSGKPKQVVSRVTKGSPD